LKAVGLDLARPEFVLGSSYQLDKDYAMDRFKLEGITRINVAQKAGAEVVKISANNADSKIDLLDGPAVAKKLKKAVCTPKEAEGNGVVAFVEHVIFRAIALKFDRESMFTVQRRDQDPLVYESIQKLKED
jgi:hypothetical protein